MPNIPGVEQINWGGVISQTMYWTGIILIAVIIIAAFVAIYYLTLFKIKATVITMYGSARDGTFSFGKPKKNRLRWNRGKTAWLSLFPLGNKIEREPFDTEFIYPGKEVYIFELNDLWVPGRININVSEDDLRMDINPVPYYVRNWQSLTHKKNAIEFAKHSFWEDNKYFIMGTIAVLICCSLCGATIYFTYKFATGGTAALSGLSQAINNMGNIPGVVPK